MSFTVCRAGDASPADPNARADRASSVMVTCVLLNSRVDHVHKPSDSPVGGLRGACGASPVEMSSGKTRRRRFNRGGNRQANAALFRIAMTRRRIDARLRCQTDRGSPHQAGHHPLSQAVYSPTTLPAHPRRALHRPLDVHKGFGDTLTRLAAGFAGGAAAAWRYVYEAATLLTATAHDLHEGMSRIPQNAWLKRSPSVWEPMARWVKRAWAPRSATVCARAAKIKGKGLGRRRSAVAGPYDRRCSMLPTYIRGDST
jgi:hypothetical protein